MRQVVPAQGSSSVEQTLFAVRWVRGISTATVRLIDRLRSVHRQFLPALQQRQKVYRRNSPPFSIASPAYRWLRSPTHREVGDELSVRLIAFLHPTLLTNSLCIASRTTKVFRPSSCTWIYHTDATLVCKLLFLYLCTPNSIIFVSGPLE